MEGNMSEPDRFEAKGWQIARSYSSVLASETRDLSRVIAAALRAAESSALERAAQEYDGAALANVTVHYRDVAKRIRALIPPAAVPAAETGKAQGAEALQSIRNRITEYLSHGGLLNPDLMDHDAVSRLLQDARAAIDAALAARTAPPEGEGT